MYEEFLLLLLILGRHFTSDAFKTMQNDNYRYVLGYDTYYTTGNNTRSYKGKYVIKTNLNAYQNKLFNNN